MTGGYTGKILRLNLTTRSQSIMDTSKYEEYGGGVGFGVAIFWELCADKLPMDAFDSRNIVTMFTGPLAGTLVPAASRTEMGGIGPQPYPIGWYTRGNMGGRFATEMKYAGWDGIVIEGKADKPVWINIVNDKVTFNDATALWGKDAWTTQERIWAEVTGTVETGDWRTVNNASSTQTPAVACIGPLGEVMARDLGVVLTDAGSAVGQGGFGAVWGSKNLKAVSVLGTGSVPIADPKALVAARIWSRQFVDRPDVGNPTAAIDPLVSGTEKGPHLQGMRGPGGTNFKYGDHKIGPQSCVSCPFACRMRFDSKNGNDSHCVDASLYNSFISARYKDTNVQQDKNQEVAAMVQKAGANVFALQAMIEWLVRLYNKGVIGHGKAIETDLPFEMIGDPAVVEMLLDKIVRGDDIGKDLREGSMRAAEKWGRLKEDLDTGTLMCPWWGYREHEGSRKQADWSFYSMMADRDINEHGITNFEHRYPQYGYAKNNKYPVQPEEVVNIVYKKLIPFNDDPIILDENDVSRYGTPMAKLVAWQAYYSRFWKEGINFCDWGWPDFVNATTPDHNGWSPEGEPKFFNAVTGKNITFAQGMEVGRKVWNWTNAIWALQGRTRDLVKFAGYVYDVPDKAEWWLLAYENGKWIYKNFDNRVVDRQKFEDWKTKYYELEGWDTKTGWPTRKALEGVGLKNVADFMESKGKLGSA